MIHLVCEGFLSGLDRRVLDALVVNFHNLSVIIQPAGGATGHRAVRAYLESRVASDVAISIEDRDYGTRADADATWTNVAGRRFTWRRHQIENYLLHPAVVLNAFNEFRKTQAWASMLPATEPDVSSLLQAIATPLLDDHAAQMLRVELVSQLNSFGLSFGPSPPNVPDAAGWLAALQAEATRLRQSCTTVSTMTVVDAAQVETRFQELRTQFQAPSFIQRDYLIDVKGKRLIAGLCQHLHGIGAPAGLDQDVLADELLQALTVTYQPNTIYQPDDFAELAVDLRRF